MSVIKTTYKLLPTQYKFAYGFDKSKLNDDNIYLDVSLYQGGFTCVPSDTEYLSPTGWKQIKDLTKQDKLAVYYDDGSIKYERPKEVFRYPADEWYEFHTRTLYQKVCPNHKMVTWKDGNKYVQSMEEFYDEHINCKQGHRGRFRTTFIKDGTKSGLTEKELRLLVAYQADGTTYNYNSKYNCRFHLCKQRKVERLISLLDSYEYRVAKQTDGDTCIYINLPEKLKVKTFPKEWYNLSSEELRIIVDECAFWDGTVGEKHNCYYTSIKENADFIQFAGSASGYRTTIFTRTRPSTSGSGKPVTEYRINFNTNVEPSLYATRNKAEIIKSKAKGGDAKYCPSTTTGMWLARYKNYIFVTGNS